MNVMDHPKEEEADKPTVRAVIVEAERLRNRAQMDRAVDPFAKPYSPSEATARGLSQRLGPEEAILELKRRAADAQARYRADVERSENARKRLDRQQRQSDQVYRHRLSGLTLGQRLDEALAALVTVSEVKAARLDAEVLTGSKGDGPDVPSTGDVAGRWRDKALELVVRVEEQVPRARRRVRGEAA